MKEKKMNKELINIVRHNILGCDDILNCKNTRPETRVLYAIDYLQDSIKALKAELESMREEGEI
jgi:multimeric flavodoxin WrbA